MIARLPRWSPGQRIGLLGGTFNPPHEGHLVISLYALKRLRLDRIWWLVTPGNPLKRNDSLPSLAERLASARALARDPRLAVTGFEAEIGARFTADTIEFLRRRAGSVHFVWIMGADNLRQFHRWRRWSKVAEQVPIAVVDRPGSTFRALSGHAGGFLGKFRVAESQAADFAMRQAPAFIFLHGPRSMLSSSAIRRDGAAVRRVEKRAATAHVS
ncbi:MAG TPA: nicotinate-nucleotide adenylyltransferase [Roseiarcus sp.]|jgi:nicotinate-nucleotide adenylyltransferase|nr:nicotinate-nucleotide adenylyltransferase [Roseiarcus sp.]